MMATFRVLMCMGALQRLAPFWVLAMVVLVWQFSVWMLVALAYGALVQFFVEYLMHRFVFHGTAPQDQGPFNELYRNHIGHHEYPSDPEFFTGGDHWYPVRFAVMSVLAHTLVLWPFVGLNAAAAWSCVALFGGSITAYTYYEYCHTLAHLRIPKGRFGQYVTRAHLAHHYQDHHATFHVSGGMGWIDRIMGTPHDPAEARARFDRATLLSIGIDPEDLRIVEARKAFGITHKPGSAKAR